MRVALSVSRLAKAFGALRVTDDVSFEVLEGEILGIIGGNGAGKTTLFALLAGNLQADAGRIEFRGLDITGLAPHRRARAGLARTYQIPKPFGHMSVAENLLTAALFGAGLELAEARDQVREIAELTGLSQVLSTPAGRLPLLQRKRHELARALAMKPRLVLIDEVAAGLTDREVALFIRLVQTIRDRGVTVIWIEHVMQTMLTATDRLLALDAGRVIALGAPREVIDSEQVRRVYLGA